MTSLAACMLGSAQACAAPSAANNTATPPARVVAIGDLHGDLDNAMAALKLAGLVDERGQWVGGTATLVQTGDTTDRGPQSRSVLALLRRLQAQAQAAGGRVVALLGNHESMNMLGDWRYVHPGDLVEYGGAEARERAFSAQGEDGRWLRTLDAVAIVQGTVFVHGGVAPQWAARGLLSINDSVRAAHSGAPNDSVGPGGPLWFRDYVLQPEATACGNLTRSLVALGAVRMVVGHTTRRDGQVESRCGGQLHVIDIGIADAYGGHIGVWESTGGDARALYPTGPVDLEDPPQ